MDVNSGLLQHRRPRHDGRVERRDDVERGEQHRDEHAHRPLVGRQLDVEIRQAEQPHERGDRRGGADQRRVAGLHRLHADQEGVREDAAAEERRRQPAGARVAPGEVRGVRAAAAAA